MEKENNQKNKRRTKFSEIAWSLIYISTIYSFLQGYFELIKNQTVGVITFYTLIAILIILKLGALLDISLNMIFNKEDKQ